MIIAVYAPHDPRDKRMLWDYLAHVINQWQGEVVIMGDFNEVRVKSDRFGTNFNVLGANIFNSFINSTGLEEVHLGGSAFTGVHNASLLDRFLVGSQIPDSSSRQWVVPVNEFQFYKGLKQGDPLSPFLFILVMESLHLSFQRIVNAGMFKGIVLDQSLCLSHMFYADDAIFLGASGVDTSSKRTAKLGCSVLKCTLYYLRGLRVGGVYDTMLQAMAKR
ncbi:RNA-directed DNA polymerase, eukaryota [Tanacetum coccineum]